MGMINAAAEVFKAAGTDLVVIVQLTWSTGGDTMTVRPSVRTPNDLKGKTIALQLYGPAHGLYGQYPGQCRDPPGASDLTLAQGAHPANLRHAG